MICQSCGHDNPAHARLCTNCGATIAKQTLASPVSTIGMVALGLILGFAGTALLWFAGTAFQAVGFQSRAEFAVSQGSAWFYLLSLLATIAALVVLFLRPFASKMSGNVRTLLLAAFFVMLGGMSLCNLFSTSGLFRS